MQRARTEPGDRRWIAACGLDCSACAIRRLPFDPDAAVACVDWYRKRGWLSDEEGANEAIARRMYCHGCRGHRSVHWSVKGDKTCFILDCCVDQRGLSVCSECGEFPCEPLTEWSTRSPRYAEALERLREMHTREEECRS